jgi:aspartate racemase
MRTIGVLGGIGPQATMDFEARVHAVTQRLAPVRYNEGYPPMVSVYLRHPPVLVEDGRPTDPLTLDPRMLEAARRLGQWADLIVIPSNTPHYFLDRLGEASGCEILSMVDVTVTEIRRRAAQPVGLVGLGLPRVYVERLEHERLRTVTAPPELRRQLDTAILRLMEGRETVDDRAAARAAVDAVREAGAAVTLLGCTEIPLLLGDGAEASDLVNPAQLLAEAAVRAAI